MHISKLTEGSTTIHSCMEGFLDAGRWMQCPPPSGASAFFCHPPM
jgi:hypothetical protein